MRIFHIRCFCEMLGRILTQHQPEKSVAVKKIFSLLLVMYLPLAHGHGMVHEQIEALTRQLQNEPNNSDALIERGRLFIEDENYLAARADFKQVLKIDKDTRSAHYYLGDVALKVKRYKEAVRHAQTFISTLNREAGGLTRGYRLLGAAYTGIGDYSEASKSYQKAIDVSQEPRPAFFYDLADAYEKQGQPIKALEALEQGIKTLGPLVILQDRALKIEISLHNYTAALKRVNHMIESGQRLAILYERKAHILEQSGNPIEAKANYQQAMAELQKIPQGRRGSPLMLSLQQTLQAKTNEQ